MVTRHDLHSVYKTLRNDQKNKWAEEANYTRYGGLLQYLKNNPDAVPYPRVLTALKKVIGTAEYEKVIGDSSLDKECCEKLFSSLAIIPVGIDMAEDVENLKKAQDILSQLITMIGAKIAYKESFSWLKSN